MAKERIRLARRRIGSDATHPPRPLNPWPPKRHRGSL